MSDVPLLLPQVTVHRGQFWFRDNDNVCYSIGPETAHEIVYHWRLLPSSMKEGQISFTVGPYRVTKKLIAHVELPLRTPRSGTQAVQVSMNWIGRVYPLLYEALSLHNADTLDAFTLVIDDDNNIIRTTPDRQSIPPMKE